MLGSRRVGVHRSMSLSRRARVAYEPFGVVGVIGAGSAPFAQPLGQIAGALLAGNGVVFKPARRACLTGERIARVLARAGLPEGLVRLVHGGTQVGVALARSPVDKVLFTGSPTVGRAVARACVSQEKEVTVELGGKDAMLVLADAHVARAASGALWAGCAGRARRGARWSGCTCEREVAERLPHAPGERRAGDARGGPRAPGRADRPAGLRAAPGARARAGRGGGRAGRAAALRRPAWSTPPEGWRRGAAFYAPAVLSGVTHEMRVMREPLDGPVLAVMAVDSTDRAMELANDGEYALGASIWTRRPSPGAANRAGAAHGDGVAQRPPPRPRDRARPVGRGGRRRPRPHARRDRPARLRAGEADRVEPLRRARAVVAPLRRRCTSAPPARSRSCAPARDADRERAWRQGMGPLVRVGMRSLRR